MPIMEIRSFLANEWRSYRQIRLRALTDAPYAFGTTLAEAQSRTDEQWQSRFSASLASALEYPLLALVDGQPAGLVWGHIDAAEPEVAHLFQMWVDPQFRRLHLGEQMVAAVVTWAKEAGADYVELDVVTENSAAHMLYEKCGFVRSGKPHSLRPGSSQISQTMRLWFEK